MSWFALKQKIAMFLVLAGNELFRFRTKLFLVKMLRTVHNLVCELEENPFLIGGKGGRRGARIPITTAWVWWCISQAAASQVEQHHLEYMYRKMLHERWYIGRN